MLPDPALPAELWAQVRTVCARHAERWDRCCASVAPLGAIPGFVIFTWSWKFGLVGLFFLVACFLLLVAREAWWASHTRSWRSALLEIAPTLPARLAVHQVVCELWTEAQLARCSSDERARFFALAQDAHATAAELLVLVHLLELPAAICPPPTLPTPAGHRGRWCG